MLNFRSIYLPVVLICASSVLAVHTNAQSFNSPSQTEEEYDAEYQRRIQKEVLFGIYIPTDLEDAFRELRRLSDQGALDSFKAVPEHIVVPKLHFGLGRWISHNWGFYGGSRFSHYLRNLGLTHPDDMIRFVLTTFHRHINGQPLGEGQLIKDLSASRQRELEKRKAQNEVLSVEKRIRSEEERDH